MDTPLDILQNIEIAAPCSADWSEMTGNERVRFCGDCKLNVYNLSAMTAAEAMGLIRETEGRLCGRFYRRPDGTILTQDCPKGLRAIVRRRLAGVAAHVGAVAVCVAGFLVGARLAGHHPANGSRNGPLTNIRLLLWPPPRYAVTGRMVCNNPPPTVPAPGMAPPAPAPLKAENHTWCNFQRLKITPGVISRAGVMAADHLRQL